MIRSSHRRMFWSNESEPLWPITHRFSSYPSRNRMLTHTTEYVGAQRSQPACCGIRVERGWLGCRREPIDIRRSDGVLATRGPVASASPTDGARAGGDRRGRAGRVFSRMVAAPLPIQRQGIVRSCRCRRFGSRADGGPANKRRVIEARRYRCRTGGFLLCHKPARRTVRRTAVLGRAGWSRRQRRETGRGSRGRPTATTTQRTRSPCGFDSVLEYKPPALCMAIQIRVGQRTHRRVRSRSDYRTGPPRMPTDTVSTTVGRFHIGVDSSETC